QCDRLENDTPLKKKCFQTMNSSNCVSSRKGTNVDGFLSWQIRTKLASTTVEQSSTTLFDYSFGSISRQNFLYKAMAFSGVDPSC
ncbi:hypothetical protein KQX54_000329, partial [Cotesia glomerata]